MGSNDLIKSTYSHCYYIIALNFVTKINECTDAGLKTILTRLFSLFTCSTFLDDNWGETLAPNQHSLIKETINELMTEIRPDAIAITDAFDYSDNLLKSSIGGHDGNVYENLFDAAQKSELNQQEVFDGYKEYLAPHLDMELLKKGNKPNTK